MIKRFRNLVTVVGAVSACLLLQTAASAQPTIWTVPSLQRVGPSDAAGSGTQAQLYAGKGEYESFQIIVKAPGTGLSNVNVSVTDLTSSAGQTISKSNIALFREQYVNVTSSSPNWGGSNQPLPPGWYPDGLIPFVDANTGLPASGGSIQAVPFSLSSGQNQPIWVDVFVPRSAAAGLYSGTYTVTSSQGSASGSISLQVWNFTLPLKPTLKSSFLYWSAGSLQAQQELLRNKVSPSSVSATSELGLITNFGLGETNTGPYSGADVSNCTMTAAPSVATFQSLAAAQQPGLYLYDYSADEIDNCPSLFTTLKQWAYNMHKAGINNLVTMSPNTALFDDGSGTGRSVVDDWVMLPVMYDSSVSTAQQAYQKGDELWSYNTLVQDSYSPKWEIDFAPINFRIQPGFISQSLNLSGMLYWRIDDWNSSPWTNPNNAGTFASANYPGEAVLVYPGSTVGVTGVAPSMRLKWIRDGVEDYEYVNLLKQAGKGTWALQIAASVGPNWTSWTRDINALASARMQLGQELDTLGGGSTVSAPPAPTSPSPASGAANISTNPTLSWAASAGATSYDVYFGTSSSPALVKNVTTTSYAPGMLGNTVTYYWKVVAKNTAGSTSSAVWSFITDPPTLAVPSTPTSPSPASGTTGVSTAPTLSWAASSNASSYDVYFGTTSSPALVKNVTTTSYAPGTLSNSKTYYWKVVAKNTSGSAASAVWSFITAAATSTSNPPPAPASPNPANGATGVSITPTLTWAASSNATSYDVYFGTTLPPPLVMSVTATSYRPGTLSSTTTYYWKVLGKNASGSTSSPTWWFNTATVTVSNADTTPPSVSISAPLAGATVSGTAVAVSGTATDNVGVVKVELDLDGTAVTSVAVTSAPSSPFSFSWNSTTKANGSHTISVKAYDVANNVGSASVSVNVSNTTTTANQPLLLIHADATEASGVANGSTVTPSIAPAGFTGKLVVNGTGSVNFAPAEVGNGVYFLNCCSNTNNAYYQFSGTTIGNIFHTNQGQISFDLRSRYSFAQRALSASSARFTFDVRDGNGTHMFYFMTLVSSGSLMFSYAAAGAHQYYVVPQGTEDTLFGSGVTLGVTLSWNGSTMTLSLNGKAVNTGSYTAVAPSWTSASVFDLGAYGYLSSGYNASDDIIDEFTLN